MKLLISDLDGTLYPKTNKEIQLKRNVDAIKKWIKQGNKFAVATARGLHHYSYLYNVLGFDVNFIGCNGAATRFEDGKEIIKTMPCQIYIDLCNYVLENHINAGVATGYDDAWVWSSKDCYPIGYNLFKPGVEETIKVANLKEMDPTVGVDRIQIYVPENDLIELRTAIESMNLPVIVTTSDTNLIDIGPLNSSKGISIHELCNEYHIDLKDIISIGDSENDIPMFQVSNTSYCIEHASIHVKNHATNIVSSVEEAIERELKKC